MGREVHIASIESRWRAGNPEIMLRGIRVVGDSEEEDAFSSTYVVMELEWRSLLSLWPSLRNVTIHEPMVEVTSSSFNI